MVNKLRLICVSTLLSIIAVFTTVAMVIVTQDWSGIWAVIFFVQRQAKRRQVPTAQIKTDNVWL